MFLSHLKKTYSFSSKNFPLERIGKAKDAKVDFEKMTELLAYWNTKLEKTRLNAWISCYIALYI